MSAAALPNGHSAAGTGAGAGTTTTRSAPNTPRNIVIIGGGIIGVCTAYYLVRDPLLPKGATVTLVEGTEIAAGASGHAGGFLARDEEWFTEATKDISRLGYDLHKALAEEHGGAERWGYRALDTFSITVDPSQPATGSPVPWLPHATAFSPRGTTAGTAQAMPNPLVKHLCSVFLTHPSAALVVARCVGISTTQDEAGSESESARVTGVHVEAQEDTHGDLLHRQTLPCDALVLAAGPWLGKLAVRLLGEDVGKQLHVWGAQANSIILRTREPLTPHAVFARINMGGREDENEPEVYCRPDGTTYFCGTAGDDPLPETAHKLPVCPAALKKLHAEARALAPVFRQENGASVVREQACYLPKSGKDRPLVGRVSGVDGVWVGGGHDVWGIVQGPGTGLVLSEMILGKATSVDVGMLAP